ncbi:MAG TPA: hypothetical protein VF721_18685 [Pyrinomonadaceae bacterium]|jgi:Na+-transporting methylmalonyl-CoA/oxaloacetate decarboxylase gamma subunit
MNYVFIFLFIAVLVIALYYLFRKRFRIDPIEKAEQNIAPAERVERNKPSPVQKSGSTDKVIKQLPVNDYELIQLRQQLNTIVLHNNRLYQNNIEIARRDFIKRGLDNPSETELLKRAIEIWQDDNR